MLYWKCWNCHKWSAFNSLNKTKPLKETVTSRTSLRCDNCKSNHFFTTKYKRGVRGNAEAYLENYERFEVLKKYLTCCTNHEKTNTSEHCNGIMTNLYLILGLDKNLQKNFEEKITNPTDKLFFNNCWKMLKLIRNKVSQHNKNVAQLSSFQEKEIFPLFIETANTLVLLAQKHDFQILQFEDKNHMKNRKLILNKKD